MKMMKVRRLSIVVLWGLVMLSFITTQLTNDFFVFWAYGRFVSNSSLSGIQALIETWEMKGLLFKSYLYFEYALTSNFSTGFDAECQTIYKIIGLLIYLGIFLLTVSILPNKYFNGFKRIDYFLIGSICLIAVHFASHFQAEMWGVLLLLLSFSIYLHEGRLYKIIAAFIYILTFFLKSPIPLLGGSIIAAALYLNNRDKKKSFADSITFVVTALLFLSLCLLFIYVYYPQELEDIWNASYFQSTLLHTYDKILSSCFYLLIIGIYTLPYYPITIVGFIFFVVLAYILFNEKRYSHIVLLLLVWIFPIMYVLISNCYYCYHYYMLVLSSILTLMIAINELHISKRVFLTLFVMTFIYYIISLSSICPTNIYEKKIYNQSLQIMKEKDNITIGSRLGSGSVLFLDSGIGAFLFSNQSYLRYFYPLPLQRISSSDEFSRTLTYKLIKEKAMAYTGEYLTLDKEWFMSNNNVDIYNKILNEYFLFKKVSFNGYSWTLFRKEKAPTTLLIYKRRKN